MEGNLKRFVVAIMIAVFSFTAAVAFAADPWFVIKDKNGVCKIIQAKDKTPAAIAGPYTTKAKAEKDKDKACAAVKK
jgi:hypothetical protein